MGALHPVPPCPSTHTAGAASSTSWDQATSCVVIRAGMCSQTADLRSAGRRYCGMRCPIDATYVRERGHPRVPHLDGGDQGVGRAKQTDSDRAQLAHQPTVLVQGHPQRADMSFAGERPASWVDTIHTASNPNPMRSFETECATPLPHGLRTDRRPRGERGTGKAPAVSLTAERRAAF